MTHHDDEEDEGWVKRSEPSDHSVGEYENRSADQPGISGTPPGNGRYNSHDETVPRMQARKCRQLVLILLSSAQSITHSLEKVTLLVVQILAVLLVCNVST